METYHSYREYLASDCWRQLRREALTRDGFACRLCPRTDGLEVHHRRYPAGGWGTETVDDLTTLCSVCHAHHHTDWMREDAEWQAQMRDLRRSIITRRRQEMPSVGGDISNLNAPTFQAFYSAWMECDPRLNDLAAAHDRWVDDLQADLEREGNPKRLAEFATMKAAWERMKQSNPPSPPPEGSVAAWLLKHKGD